MISVNDIEAPVGVRISGCDLSRPADDADFRVIHEAFLGRHVVSLAGQGLTPEQLIDFSRRLGPLEPHVLAQHHLAGYPEIIVLSNIVENGQPLGLADAGTYWHSDISYKARPSRTTVLYALEVPDEGGDTLFSNLEAAYQGLSAPMKERLDGLQAVHNYAYRPRPVGPRNWDAITLDRRPIGRNAFSNTSRGAYTSRNRPESPLCQPRLHHGHRRTGRA